MRNDARPIGEEFRDIAEHHRERERARPKDNLAPNDREVRPRPGESVNRETLDQPPPTERSDR
jgi:hypothetical protein